jgi:hypothetical protein
MVKELRKSIKQVIGDERRKGQHLTLDKMKGLGTNRMNRIGGKGARLPVMQALGIGHKPQGIIGRPYA